MLLAAGILLAAGVLLLLAGLRGTRIDTHPLCRACRFDLVGLPPPLTRCPECGTDLARARATRIGHRRRVRPLIGAACLSLLVALGLGGAAIWSRATNFNWNTVKPVWWLKSDAGSTDTPTAGAAVAELARRLKDGKLAESETRTLLERALAAQADHDRAWVPDWAGFVDTAWNAELLTEDQVNRYIRQGLDLSVGFRARIIQAEAAPIRLTVTAPRLARGRQVFLVPRLTDLRVAEHEIAPPMVTGRLSAMSNGSCTVANSVNIDVPVGEHLLISKWSVRINETQHEDARAITQWTFDTRTPITVLPPGEEVVRLVPDESVRASIEAGLRCDPLRPRTAHDGTVWLDGSLTFTSLTRDVAFDIFWRTGGSAVEYPAGSLALKGGFSGQHGYGYGAPAPAADVQRLDVILRPSTKAAANDPDITDIWGGEITIENVPVKWPER